MIAAAVLALSFVLPAAYEPHQPPMDAMAARLQLTAKQKEAMLRPLMRSATDCIVQAVAANPRFRMSMAPADLNVLIVASMDGCVAPMRAMIDAHDRLYGEGSGEEFFAGPYLDVLPEAVNRQVHGSQLHGDQK